MLVAIDGLNVCWGGSRSRRIDDSSKFYQANDFSFIHHYRRMLQPDWPGGAVVCSCTSSTGSSTGSVVAVAVAVAVAVVLVVLLRCVSKTHQL